ncbi:MAG: hypothetical protein WDN04_04545 [Rhodospirillales bacterium]
MFHAAPGVEIGGGDAVVRVAVVGYDGGQAAAFGGVRAADQHVGADAAGQAALEMAQKAVGAMDRQVVGAVFGGDRPLVGNLPSGAYGIAPGAPWNVAGADLEGGADVAGIFELDVYHADTETGDGVDVETIGQRAARAAGPGSCTGSDWLVGGVGV